MKKTQEPRWKRQIYAVIQTKSERRPDKASGNALKRSTHPSRFTIGKKNRIMMEDLPVLE